MSLGLLIGIGAGAAVVALALFLAFIWRVVVPTNLVHIVQSSKKTTSYGAGGAAGNTYYNIPSFVPIFGVTRISLPINNFSIRLDAYEAYDKDRAPFELDIIGFFVINDTNIAAARAASFHELELQLKSIMQGAARTILAKHDIEVIMGDRATFGTAFTTEVDEGLQAWGVKTVKTLELMDIRDTKGSKIIANIMAKKSSHIEMESRKVVADNNRQAQLAEIEATQQVDIRKQEQQQLVGQRTAAQEREVGIAREKAAQEVQQEAAVTMERKMEVKRVEQVRTAENNRAAAVVLAEQEKLTEVIHAEAARAVAITEAEGSKQQTVLVAEGNKESALLEAAGIKAKGEAKGAADTAIALAPVTAQITLAEKIGSDEGYQKYLVQIREVEAKEKIGIEQAKALDGADIKVIANGGTVAQGISSVGDIMSPNGGTQLGGMLDALKNTEVGKTLIDKFTK